jgi:hypothetical protein
VDSLGPSGWWVRMQMTRTAQIRQVDAARLGLFATVPKVVTIRFLYNFSNRFFTRRLELLYIYVKFSSG